jgi:multidrug efflux pump subunit AcrA (membrane-fusion protein)
MSEGKLPDPHGTTATTRRPEGPTAETPQDSDGPFARYVATLLSVQCQSIQAQKGAVLRFNGDGTFAIVASYPQSKDAELTNSDWLEPSTAAGGQVLSQGRPRVVPIQGSERTHAILLPLQLQSSGPILEAFLVKTANRAALESTQRLLQLTVVLVGLTDQNAVRLRAEGSHTKLHQAMATLSAANCHNRFVSVAMSVCNELAAQWKCESVSLGFLKGRYIRVKAISHTEHFGGKMRLVQDIEATMEECLDQDSEVVFPASDEETCVYRAAQEFSSQHNRASLLSLPLRHEGQPEAVVTLERPADRAFTPEEVEAIRLTCDLCSPRLMNLRHYDRWIGARAAAGVQRGLATVLGAQHTWAKLVAVGVFGLAVFLTFARGWYRVKAPFTLEAVSQYKITAPFDGYIKDVHVEVGDQIVEKQTTLAELDTAELRLQLASTRAEQAGYFKQADAAMRDGRIAEAQIARANADKAQALIDLYNYRIDQARILAPLTGTLVTGDLKRQIGAPVETGKVLFEIAPLDSLRAEAYVPEDEVTEVKPGQQGLLATASFPGQRIRFIVERVNPAAEVVNNRNVFKVRVRLIGTKPWLRPGMEGVAKIAVEKRRYAWIWSRKVVNWIRMKLWI